MGNCHTTADVAAAVVQHPGNNGKVEKLYLKMSANEVMGSNPGYYVALVVESSTDTNNAQPPKNVKKQFKLLRPTDTLHVGHVYRLISFEDVIKEFTAKKSVKLGKLLEDSGVLGSNDMEEDSPGSSIGTITSSKRISGGGQWKPALQSIAEVGS